MSLRCIKITTFKGVNVVEEPQEDISEVRENKLSGCTAGLISGLIGLVCGPAQCCYGSCSVLKETCCPVSSQPNDDHPPNLCLAGLICCFSLCAGNVAGGGINAKVGYRVGKQVSCGEGIKQGWRATYDFAAGGHVCGKFWQNVDRTIAQKVDERTAINRPKP